MLLRVDPSPSRAWGSPGSRASEVGTPARTAGWRLAEHRAPSPQRLDSTPTRRA
ncbi:hypothetical protein [Leptolyngbya sp. 7M]|uniref:hypothetical protein n=1 Tax=Leptolyngbya sp. 7M TaxID=2812896 RepID=UPI001B8C21FD|nr:hypothetical protein [Leptolyngbya sp. 7M]QYO64940.1 hypothetical protein JVX88_36340 [Leptolyngbya sp. 7M]